MFPSPSLHSLVLTAVSHRPGASLLQHCISLSVSEHHLSHCHPQHAINIALADSYVVLMEVSKPHQHLILVACAFASVSSYAEIVHTNICLILFVKFQHCWLHGFRKWSFRWVKLTEQLWQRMGNFVASLAATLMRIWPLSELIKLLTYKIANRCKKLGWFCLFVCFLLHLWSWINLLRGQMSSRAGERRKEGTTGLGGGHVRARERKGRGTTTSKAGGCWRSINCGAKD